MKNNIVVYTAIFGDVDNLQTPRKTKGCDYVCFTDRAPVANDSGWDIRVKEPHLSSRRTARYYKILPHRYFSEYEYSIWVDGTCIPIIEPQEIINSWATKCTTDIAMFKHSQRNCIYQERIACEIYKKDHPSNMDGQINRYRKEGYPEHNGLVASGIIIRRHNSENLIKAMESWWKELEHGSKRDQLSFNYVAYKHGLKYSIIPGCIWRNNLFTFISHKRKR